jgi:hypothetical protein
MRYVDYALASRPAHLLAAVALVAACTMEEPRMPDPATPLEGDACNSAAFRHLIGQPASALATVALPERTRVIRPGTMVTMDYNAQRLNVDLDARDRIVSLRCG